MSSTARKPQISNDLPAQRTPNSTPVSARGPSRSPTPSASPAPNGHSRSRSIRGNSMGSPVSARAAAKRPGPGMSKLSASNNGQELAAEAEDQDTRAEQVAVIEDLKDQLQKAESASDSYQRQLGVLTSRLDDALSEQGKLEDKLHETDSIIKGLEAEKRDWTRQQREMEQIYEAERIAMLQEKEDFALREDELHSVIQRLKEGVAQREVRSHLEDESVRARASNNSSPGMENGHFAPPSVVHRSESRNNSKLLLQKDKVIESLRLELAEAHIKLVESENMGGGRVQELERILLETRMTNARLMEDNESFQLLLGEKTLNGDFSNTELMQGPVNLYALDEKSESRAQFDGTSLEAELQTAEDADRDSGFRLEAEVRSLRDQNKALTLYINNIIERLLQHEDFEAILDKTPNLMAVPRSATSNLDKDLPPPPPKKSDSTLPSRMTGGVRRPRPFSVMPSSSSSLTSNQQPFKSPPSITDDPHTAPSIPLGRSQSMRASAGLHRRSTSEWPNPATVVGQMYRGPPSGGSASPVISPGTPGSRQSLFALPRRGGESDNPNAAARIPSGGPRPGTIERAETWSPSDPDNRDSTFAPGSHSPPASVTSSAGAATREITGNKLRPLRLVQESSDGAGGAGGRKVSDGSGTDADEKKAKRGSWMGWFNKGKGEEAPLQQGPMGGVVVKE